MQKTLVQYLDLDFPLCQSKAMLPIVKTKLHFFGGFYSTARQYLKMTLLAIYFSLKG